MNPDLDQFEVPAAPGQPAQQTAVDETVSREAKLAFLAHILTGAAFLQRYEIAHAGFLEFATASASELDRIRQLVAQLPSPHLRRERAQALMAVACVNRLEIDGRVMSGVRSRSWLDTSAYEDFVAQLPIGLLHIIESHYLDFSRVLACLIGKVSDRSFWPTP